MFKKDGKAKKNKPVTLRIPESNIRDVDKIASQTGHTKNSVWIDVVRIGIREVMKELGIK